MSVSVYCCCLQADPSALIQSPQYSKVFGIILYDVSDQEVQVIEELPRKRCKNSYILRFSIT